MHFLATLDRITRLSPRAMMFKEEPLRVHYIRTFGVLVLFMLSLHAWTSTIHAAAKRTTFSAGRLRPSNSRCQKNLPGCAITNWVNSVGSDEPLEIQAFPLKYKDASWMSKQVTARWQRTENIVIAFDTFSNTVFVRASADKIRQLRRLINLLDVPTHVVIMPLKNIRVDEAVEKLALLGQDGMDLIVTPDRNTNSIVISANETTIQKAMDIIRQMDNKRGETDGVLPALEGVWEVILVIWRGEEFTGEYIAGNKATVSRDELTFTPPPPRRRF